MLYNGRGEVISRVQARPVPDGLIRIKELTGEKLFDLMDERRRRDWQNRTRPKRRPRLGYQHPDLGETNDADPHQAADLRLCQQAGMALEFHYPGHPWRIEVDHRKNVGVLTIELPPILTKPACGIVKLTDIKSDPGLRAVIRVAGEILERFRLSRGRYNHADFIAARNRRSIRDVRRGVVPV